MNRYKYIMDICNVVKDKSDCERKKIGAVFVNREFEILATGYNNPPSGFAHCDGQKTCLNNLGHCTRTIHAEQNAIVQAAKRGVALKGSIMFCNYSPCVVCAKLLVNLQVSAVYFDKEYDEIGLSILREGLIETNKWSFFQETGAKNELF
jgi:dCMP deaminase